MKALITGGSDGIGKELAIELSKRGYDLIIVSRNEDKLLEIKNTCSTEVRFISKDLSKQEECFDLIKQMKDKDIDLFINNAGFGDIGRFDQTSTEKEIKMVELNDIATLILVKAFLNKFTKENKGRILITASASSFGVAGYMNVYYATKSFVYSLAHGYYRELKDMKSKVTISVLCPGQVKTSFEEKGNLSFNQKASNPKYIAKYTVPRFLKGKFEIVPTVKMKLAHFLSHLVPKKMISKILNKQAEMK